MNTRDLVKGIKDPIDADRQELLLREALLEADRLYRADLRQARAEYERAAEPDWPAYKLNAEAITEQWRVRRDEARRNARRRVKRIISKQEREKAAL